MGTLKAGTIMVGGELANKEVMGEIYGKIMGILWRVSLSDGRGLETM
jgi:hypothetical protein